MSPGVALTPHALPNTPPPAAPAIFVELTQAVLQRLRDHLGQDVDGTTFPDMLAFEQWTDQFVRSTAPRCAEPPKNARRADGKKSRLAWLKSLEKPAASILYDPPASSTKPSAIYSRSPACKDGANTRRYEASLMVPTTSAREWRTPSTPVRFGSSWIAPIPKNICRM